MLGISQTACNLGTFKKLMSKPLDKQISSLVPEAIWPSSDEEEEPPAPKNARKNKEEDTCKKCHLPLVYDHIAWCRGLSDSYTC